MIKELMMKMRVREGGALLLAVAVVAVITLVAVPRTFAQTSTSASKVGNNNSLKISPLRTDVIMRPGETRKVLVYVQNIDAKPVTLKPIENDFIAGDEENGTPNIILKENEYAPTHSLKRFMVPLKPITVAGGERKTVEVTITVPQSAQAGGYFGAVRFAPANADGSENVNVTGSVASLILLTVPGNLIESMQLTDFDIQQNQKTVSRLSSPDNVSVSLRLQNKGNIQVAPFGSVFVQKGDKQIYSAKINDIKPAGLVLPDSSRKWTVPIENLDKFGKYDITLTLGYGSSGETIEVKKTIWGIPTMYIYGIIGGVIALIALLTVIFFALRSYKRRIMRHARRRRY